MVRQVVAPSESLSATALIVEAAARGAAAGGGSRHVVAAAVAAAYRCHVGIPDETRSDRVADTPCDVATSLTAAASRIHGLLDEHLSIGHHTLANSLRRASERRCLCAATLKRVRQLNTAACAVRHSTATSLQRLVSDVQLELRAQAMQREDVPSDAAAIRPGRADEPAGRPATPLRHLPSGSEASTKVTTESDSLSTSGSSQLRNDSSCRRSSVRAGGGDATGGETTVAKSEDSPRLDCEHDVDMADARVKKSAAEDVKQAQLPTKLDADRAAQSEQADAAYHPEVPYSVRGNNMAEPVDKRSLHEPQQYYVKLGEKKKTQKLVQLLEVLESSQVVIFVRTVRRALALNAMLNEDLKKNVIVTIDMGGRRVDAERFNTVVNYDFPVESDSYLHRVGCCERFMVSFLASERDEEVFKHIVSSFDVSMQALPEKFARSPG
eukprot:TRINITY_DN3226_c0_g1_i1.p1 TRINITY_DN3226_c0_g1~~TRINITY_DN3226_c0_g1_i1.p1  ORF type:complete len:465 (-),score=104.16 TRINITY_DN3226_c0_g1_i1:204-1520(-)